MEQKHYDLTVVIGRFEPLHVGHLHNFMTARKQAENVLVLVGSSFQPRTIKNPFTFDERSDMIKQCLQDIFDKHEVVGSPSNFHIEPIRDYLYEENKWVKQVQEKVADALKAAGKPNGKVCIIGYAKDNSSYYLNLFPRWDFIDIGGYQEVGEKPVSATTIRELLFNGHYPMMKGVLAETTYRWITEQFVNSGVFENLVDEYVFIQNYHKAWAGAPYAPTFNTVDGVVLQGGHVLLVERKAAPGKGLWALPGGFLDQQETCEVGMLRELREETKLKVPVPILRANITARERFDHPARSLRGRTITDAFLVELPGPEDGKLPRVKGADDAAKAKWFPLSEALAMSEKLFEDHHSIISMLTARAK